MQILYIFFFCDILYLLLVIITKEEKYEKDC